MTFALIWGLMGCLVMAAAWLIHWLWHFSPALGVIGVVNLWVAFGWMTWAELRDGRRS